MVPQEPMVSLVEMEPGENPALTALEDFPVDPETPDPPENEENQVVSDDPEPEENQEALEVEEGPVMPVLLDSPDEVERGVYLDDLARLDTPYPEPGEPLVKMVPLVPLDSPEPVELLDCLVRGEALDDLVFLVNRVLMVLTE